MPIDPKHAAIVLIEYQNDFTSEGGALHDAVQGVMDETGTLENTRRLVAAARAAGATVVHAPITFAPWYGELSAHPLSDCVAATSTEEHENAIRFDYPMFSDVMTSQELTAQLQGATTAAA